MIFKEFSKKIREHFNEMAETDPITEWLIQRNDWKLIKYAIKQKYIGKKNADALLKYTVFSGREDTDPRIIDLLVAQKNAQ